MLVQWFTGIVITSHGPTSIWKTIRGISARLLIILLVTGPVCVRRVHMKKMYWYRTMIAYCWPCITVDWQPCMNRSLGSCLAVGFPSPGINPKDCSRCTCVKVAGRGDPKDMSCPPQCSARIWDTSLAPWLFQGTIVLDIRLCVWTGLGTWKHHPNQIFYFWKLCPLLDGRGGATIKTHNTCWSGVSRGLVHG